MTIEFGERAAWAVLEADDTDPTPPHGTARPLLRATAEIVGTPEQIVNGLMRPWLGGLRYLTIEEVEDKS